LITNYSERKAETIIVIITFYPQ